MCGKAFAAKGYLDQHLDVHNADKVYPCPLCPKRFQSQPSLSQHKATHGQQGRTYQGGYNIFTDEKGVRYINNSIITQMRREVGHRLKPKIGTMSVTV